MSPVLHKNQKWNKLNINLLLLLLLNLSWEFNIMSKSLSEFKINIVKILLKKLCIKDQIDLPKLLKFFIFLFLQGCK